MRFDLAVIDGQRCVLDTDRRLPTAALVVGSDLTEHEAWALVGILNTADLSIYDGMEPF